MEQKSVRVEVAIPRPRGSVKAASLDHSLPSLPSSPCAAGVFLEIKECFAHEEGFAGPVSWLVKQHDWTV